MALRLISTRFEEGGTFPSQYTCNGQNISPPLNISGVPDGAKSLALIFDDPDAAKEPAGSGKTFDHWIIYNIPPVDQDIPEATAPAQAKLGKNSRGTGQYIGPCPPTFRHEYSFRLMALDSQLELGELPTRAEVEQAAQGHVIAEANLRAYYEQPPR